MDFFIQRLIMRRGNKKATDDYYELTKPQII